MNNLLPTKSRHKNITAFSNELELKLDQADPGVLPFLVLPESVLCACSMSMYNRAAGSSPLSTDSHLIPL